MLPAQSYIPSLDFQLFQIPNFSPLQLNEFGVNPYFSANTPTPYVDFSMNQILSILRTPNESPFPVRAYDNSLNPLEFLSFFNTQQDNTLGSLRDRLRKVRDEAQKKLEEIGDTATTFPSNQPICPEGEIPYKDILGRQRCGKRMISDGKGALGDDPTKSGEKIGKPIQGIMDFFNSLPSGSGIFLIAVVAVIFLLLFVRK